MSTITRVTKVGSGTTEFAPGTTILSNEVNTDFDRIYQDYDGFIDNTNIAAAAGIVYSKLNLSNSIVNSDINTAAGIVGTKLADAPLGIINSKINDGAVNLRTIGIGQTIRGAASALSTPGSLTFPFTDTPVSSVGLTTQGGRVFVYGEVTIMVVIDTTVPVVLGIPGGLLTCVFKMDGTTLDSRDYSFAGPTGMAIPIPTMMTTLLAAAAAHTFTFEVAGTLTSGAAHTVIPSIHNGGIAVIETA